MDLASFLNAKQIKDLARVISEAELLTSGEIRLHLEEKCEIETEARAQIPRTVWSHMNWIESRY